MRIQPEAYHCPSCGAPLHNLTGAELCLYCGSLVRLQQIDEQPGLAVDKTISEGEMVEIKQALVSGSRETAMQLYQAITGGSLEDAGQVVDDLGRELSLKTMSRQQLTFRGWIYVALWLALIFGGLWAWFNAVLPWWMALIISGAGVFLLAAIFPAVVLTLRYLNAPRARATTINYTYLGRAALRNQTVHVFKILLEVKPVSGEPFREEVLIPVRDENKDRVQAGHTFQVKYLPGVQKSVIFDRA